MLNKMCVQMGDGPDMEDKFRPALKRPTHIALLVTPVPHKNASNFVFI